MYLFITEKEPKPAPTRRASISGTSNEPILESLLVCVLQERFSTGKKTVVFVNSQQWLCSIKG